MDNFSDLAFFQCINKHGSLAAAAQELGVTPPAVSKRLAALEARLGVRLLHRTTRRISLTPEGESYLVEGARILAEMEALERAIAGSSSTPHGLLKIGATLGFGRRHIAPALSALRRTVRARARSIRCRAPRRDRAVGSGRRGGGHESTRGLPPLPSTS